MKKPLTFKQATIVVVALHVAGFIGITQYASYKAKLARELRDEKKAELLSNRRLKQDWNNKNIKPKVVATVASKQLEKPIKDCDSNQIKEMLQQPETVARAAIDLINETVNEVKTITTTNTQILNNAQEIVKPVIPITSEAKKQNTVSNQTATKEAFLATRQQTPKSSPKINIEKLKQNVQIIKREVKKLTSEGIEHESYSVQRLPNTQTFVMGSNLLEAY